MLYIIIFILIIILVILSLNTKTKEKFADCNKTGPCTSALCQSGCTMTIKDDNTCKCIPN
jgi:hypothetical protein